MLRQAPEEANAHCNHVIFVFFGFWSSELCAAELQAHLTDRILRTRRKAHKHLNQFSLLNPFSRFFLNSDLTESCAATSLSNFPREEGKGGQERCSSLKELCCKYTAIREENSGGQMNEYHYERSSKSRCTTSTHWNKIEEFVKQSLDWSNFLSV